MDGGKEGIMVNNVSGDCFVYLCMCKTIYLFYSFVCMHILDGLLLITGGGMTAATVK